MELMTLTSNMQPDTLVENYNSLIWTERYAQSGDFELVSNDVYSTINALPLESFVTIRESTVPMVVEAHKIQKPLRGAPVITVIGRSFETVLERRASVNELPAAIGRAAWMISSEKASDAAYLAMRTVLGDTAKSQNGSQILPAVSPAVSALDAIPEISLTLPADYEVGTTNVFEIPFGDLYSAVINLLGVNRRGLKAVRPVLGDTKVGIEIYNGADLTESVVFDARFDQFNSSTHLLSKVGSTDVAYVYGPNGSQIVLKTQAPEPSGLSRRVLPVDVSGDQTADTTEVRTSRGLVELYKNNNTALFEGEVAEQVAQGYNQTYYLGDILKLVGEYGVPQNVRVAEFIRTSDATGNRAYPAFETVV